MRSTITAYQTIHEEPPDFLRSKLDFILLASFFLLSTQGILNYFLGSGVLSVWKQALIVGCMFLTMAKGNVIINSSYIIISIILLFNSILNGLDTTRIIYNLFAYIAWVPFFLFGIEFDLRSNGKRHVYVCAILILVSTAGLWLQLTTPYFDFLKDPEDTYLRNMFQVEQRSNFIFNTSTVVLPVLSAFYYIAVISNARQTLKLLLVVCLVVCAVPTASLGALIMAVICVTMYFVEATNTQRIYLLASIVIIVLGAFEFGSDRVSLQIERILTNNATSDSNEERLRLWNYAVSIILNSSFIEFIFGRGIGVTNSYLFGGIVLEHGESSFFQALIEGGLIGLGLRLLPFILMTKAIMRSNHRILGMLFVLGQVVNCAVAPIFGYFGIQCALGLIAGVEASRNRLRLGSSLVQPQYIRRAPY